MQKRFVFVLGAFLFASLPAAAEMPVCAEPVAAPAPAAYGLLKGLQPDEIGLIATLLRTAPDGTRAAWTNRATQTDYALAILTTSEAVGLRCRAYTLTSVNAGGAGEAFRTICAEDPVILTPAGFRQPAAPPQ